MSKGTTKRWMKGGYEHEIRITVRCQKNEDHAKVLRFDAGMGLGVAAILAEILEGSSKHYITPPGEKSPLGKCAVCAGPLKAEVEQRHNDAQYFEQDDKHSEHPRKGHA